MTMKALTELSFAQVSCYTCGIIFGVPEELNKNHQDNKGSWWCPNGHQQAYIGSTTRELLDAAKEDLKKQRDARWQAEDKVSRQAKQIATLRRRVKEGKK